MTSIQAAKKTKKIYVIAGEPSGDFLGASIVKALQLISSSQLSLVGIGGSHLEAVGVKSIFPMKELSLMGFFEIIPNLPNLIMRFQQTLDDIQRTQPDLVLSIDAPDFNFRLGPHIKKMGIPMIHVGAPTVWAWRPGRAEKIARFLSHLLVLLPFEPPYFEKEGLRCTFMGHPLIEKELHKVDPKAFFNTYALPTSDPVLCILLGSRPAEVKRHLPIFMDTIEIIRQKVRNLHCVVPTLPQFRTLITEAFEERMLPAFIMDQETEKYSAMRAATAALAVSGTVSLELALCGTPMVIAYKMNPLTYGLARLLVHPPYISFPNLILNQPIVPECIQQACDPFTLSKNLLELLASESEIHKAQKNYLSQVHDLMMPAHDTPTATAAQTIFQLLQTEGAPR